MESLAVGRLAPSMQQRLDQSFVTACETMLACEGRVVVTGMGKSGHILAVKLPRHLASTGTPAHFSSIPGEASHGDLGMITKNDVVIAISNSGSTLRKWLPYLPLIKRLGIPLISMTGDPGIRIVPSGTVPISMSASAAKPAR